MLYVITHILIKLMKNVLKNRDLKTPLGASNNDNSQTKQKNTIKFKPHTEY